MINERPIFAFVLMPFDPKFNDVYNIGIKEAAIHVGIIAERIDEQIFVEGMMDRVYRQIEAADIIIADLSNKNANVFYELGYAHAKDKLCLLLTTDAQDIPFDLKHRRHIVYESSISYLREELIKNLEWAKTEIENVRKSQIRVIFKQPKGNLTLTAYEATVALDFQIDLFNDSNKPSSEISAIYFYSGKMWNIKQDGKACPYTESDIPYYRFRYFLIPPVNRLQKNSWAQLQFVTSKVLASKFHGDELKYNYNVVGVSVLRFVTIDGVFDYELNINVDVSEFPF